MGNILPKIFNDPSITAAARTVLDDATISDMVDTLGGAASTGTGGLVRATSPSLVTPKSTTTIGVGNATPAASGAGITFPATQSASSDANTLDDYEKGSWTPVASFGGASVGLTYVVQVGIYTKIGNRVLFSLAIYINSKGSSTGNFAISGFPFSASATPAQGTATSVYADLLSGVSGQIQNTIVFSSTTSSFWFTGVGVGTQITDVHLNPGYFVISGSYQI